MSMMLPIGVDIAGEIFEQPMEGLVASARQLAAAASADLTTTSASSTGPALLLLAQEDDGIITWRQYVPLLVIALVLVDIVLGSPVANGILNKARPQEEENTLSSTTAAATRSNENDSDNVKATEEQRTEGLPFGLSSLFSSAPDASATTSRKAATSSKERINVDQFAKQAIERAEGVTELRNYLESQKTDWDRMKELQQKMDAQMDELDAKQAERQQQENDE